MTSRVVRQRDGPGTPERRGVGLLPSTGQVRAGASSATRSVRPHALSIAHSARGVESLSWVFSWAGGRRRCVVVVGGAAASRARHSLSQAETHPSVTSGAPGCDVFREARSGPHCLSALSKRVCGLGSRAATWRALGSRASTDGRFSAKWLLATVA